MGKFNDLKGLREAIVKKAKKGMEEEVINVVHLHMRSAIRKEVYEPYPNPVKYVRRYQRGENGLDSRENIKGYFDKVGDYGFTYRIENETLPDTIGYSPTDYLTPLIVMGQSKAEAVGYPVLYHEFAELSPYGKPRDFITATKNDLRSFNAISNSLEKYMNKK